MHHARMPIFDCIFFLFVEDRGVRVSLFAPCFIDLFYPQVAISVVKVLERLGHEVDFPENQTCCGQPALNAGYWTEAREVALRFLDHFEKSEAIVCPSGSCTAMVRHFYPRLFRGKHEEKLAVSVSSRTYEFVEFLVRRLGVVDMGACFEGRVAWHDACHGLRELNLKEEPRKLLRHVRGLEFVEMGESETCCGFGGTFSVKYPSLSVAMGIEKIESLAQAKVDYISSGDSSCLMHLAGLMAARGGGPRAIHIAEILAH